MLAEHDCQGLNGEKCGECLAREKFEFEEKCRRENPDACTEEDIERDYPLYSNESCSMVTTEAMTLNHGTLVDFTGPVWGPGWFTAQLPPEDVLSLHVPLVWACNDGKEHEKLYFKRFEMVAGKAFLKCTNFCDFYRVNDQKKAAKKFCKDHPELDGFIIKHDAVDFEEEWIVCDPEKTLPNQVAEQLEGSITSETNDKLRVAIEIQGQPQTWELDCNAGMSRDAFKETPQTSVNIFNARMTNRDAFRQIS